MLRSMREIDYVGGNDSFHGGFGSTSDLGQSVTLDFSYDSGSITQALQPTDHILTAAGAKGAFSRGVPVRART
jgi:hypothetical protein